MSFNKIYSLHHRSGWLFDTAIWKALHIWRKIQDMGLWQLYLNDCPIRNHLWKTMALQFLPAEHIVPALKLLLERNGNKQVDEVLCYVRELVGVPAVSAYKPSFRSLRYCGISIASLTRCKSNSLPSGTAMTCRPSQLPNFWERHQKSTHMRWCNEFILLNDI
jgi:hypothetical protein